MENWIEQARLMITECDCSEKEKRRRIMESLKGHALEIVRAVWFSSSEASALHLDHLSLVRIYILSFKITSGHGWSVSQTGR